MVADLTGPLAVKILTPERILFEGDARVVTARTTEGDLTLYPGHMALVTTLDDTDICITPTREGAANLRFRARGGYLKVADNRILVLTPATEETAEEDA